MREFLVRWLTRNGSVAELRVEEPQLGTLRQGISQSGGRVISVEQCPSAACAWQARQGES